MVTLKELYHGLLTNAKTIFLIVYPLILIFIFFIEIFKNKPIVNAWLYTCVLMAGFWLFEPLPLPVTSMLPLVLFPLLGILDTKKTSLTYFHELNMTMVGALILGLAMEMSNLHVRIAVRLIRMIGFSYRLLSFFFTVVTVLVSMWFSNTITTCLVLPIVKGVLQELENFGLARMWEDGQEEPKVPTSITKCFYLGTAFAATLGGLGTVMGSGTNLVYYELMDGYDFGNGTTQESINFGKWFILNAPLVFLIMCPTWGILQFWYLGWGGRYSITFEPEAIQKAQEALGERMEEIGAITVHEIMVLTMCVLAMVTLFFRRAVFINPWPKWITDTKVGDATAIMVATILLFMLPTRLDFIYLYSKDEAKKPKQPSPSLITWKGMNQQMHWSLIFTMGGAFALAEGLKKSHFISMLATLNSDSKVLIHLLLLLVSLLITQVVTNADLVNIVVPVVAEFYDSYKTVATMPVVMFCSFAFLLPAATPPNAIVLASGNIRAIEFIKIGFMVLILSVVLAVTVFLFMAKVYWKLPPEFGL